MNETLVIEHENLAGIQLMPEHRLRGWPPASEVTARFVKVALRAAAYPVKDINNNKFLIVAMRFRYHVREGPEQIDAERAVGPSPIEWHQAEKGTNELLPQWVVENPDTLVVALTRDVRAIRDGDRLVFP